jgi:hypothetical protein
VRRFRARSTGEVDTNKEEARMKKALLLIVGLVVLCGGGFMLLSIAGLVGMGEAIEEAESQPGGSRNTAVAAGEALLVDDLEYVVKEATVHETLEDRDGLFAPMTPDGGGLFVLVRYDVKNAGSSQASVWGMSLEDGQERRFTSTYAMDGFMPDGENCVLESMNPGLSESCAKVFQVPPDAIGPDLMMRVGTFGLSGGYMGLGLAGE